MRRGVAAAESLFEVLDEPLEEDGGSYEKDRVVGGIEFKNVSFTYAKEKALALNNINLKIKAGQTVALVGVSGGGKSTLIKLLSRFYDNQDGEIYLDGVDYLNCCSRKASTNWYYNKETFGWYSYPVRNMLCRSKFNLDWKR